MATSPLTIQIDDEVRSRLESITAQAGLSIDEAIEQFLVFVVEEGTLPDFEKTAGKSGRGKTEKKGGKARHRWTKEMAAIEFFIDVDGAEATVVWQKRNEMLIKKGARMRKEPRLTAVGERGLEARFGDTLREEHADQFNDDFVTTEDIVLKSVNEVGLFLYYGGRNSWLAMVDLAGRTIDEWTRVDD